MIQTVVQSVGDNTVIDAEGRELTIGGNALMVEGQTIWTDGKVAYGNTMKAYLPPVFQRKELGIIPLFDRQYNRYVFQEMSVVGVGEMTIAHYMVNSNKDFAFPEIFPPKTDSAGKRIDQYLDADMDDDGNVYVFTGGECSKLYQIEKRTYGTATGRAMKVVRNINERYSSEARPYRASDNFTRSASNEFYTDTYRILTFVPTGETRNEETRLGSIARVYKNGTAIKTIGEEYFHQCESMWDIVTQGMEDVEKDTAGVLVRNVRIDESGNTNYIVELSISGTAYPEFNIYIPVIYEELDRGRAGYNAQPTGYYWQGEEVWANMEEHEWDNCTRRFMDYEKSKKACSKVTVTAKKIYFVDEHERMTLLSTSTKYEIDGHIQTDTSYLKEFYCGVSTTYMNYRTAYDVYRRRETPVSAMNTYQETSRTAKLEVYRKTEMQDVENIDRKEKEEHDQIYMLQDGFRADGKGNVYDANEYLLFNVGGEGTNVIACTEIEDGYLVGVKDGMKYGESEPFELKSVVNGEVTSYNGAWMNTRLREMENIGEWMEGEN